MYLVQSDRAKRLLVISAAGHVTKEEVKKAAQRVREIVKDASPGFFVLTDFTWLEKMDTGAAQHVAEIMEAIAEKKVSMIVRVVPDPQKDIGLNILSQFHYGEEIEVLTFESLAEGIAAIAAGTG